MILTPKACSFIEGLLYLQFIEDGIPELHNSY